MVKLFTKLTMRGKAPLAMLLALLLQVSFAQAQDLTVSGTITDSEDGSAIPGASILIQGTSQGTITDESGNYSINADPNDNLVVSFIGYTTQVVPVNGRSTIDFQMIPDIQELSEVVVTGYSSQSRRSITGSASILGSEDIEQIPVMSFDRALQGKASGVQVTNTGVPGGPTVVRIRGYGTINSNDPLYVIDGVPVQGDLSTISPNDIESIVVLKDAAAASVYGNRAANGVIVVTTKNGTRGKTQFNANVQVGVNNIAESRFPDFVTPQQLAEIVAQSQINATGSFNHPQYGSGTSASEATLPDFINPPGTFVQGNDLVDRNGNVVANINEYDLNDDNGDGVFQLMRANPQGTDWFDAILDPGQFQNYDFSVSGGSEKGTFLFGSSFYNEEGVMRFTEFTRYSSRFNSMIEVTPWLRIGENVNITYSERKGENLTDLTQDENGYFGGAWQMVGIVPAFDERGNFGGTQGNGLGTGQNPLAFLFRAKDNKLRRFRTLGSVFLEIEPIKNLVIKTLGGVDYQTSFDSRIFVPDPESSETTATNTIEEFNTWGSSINWTNTVTYENTFADDHTVKALFGTEFVEQTARQVNAARNELFSTAVNQRFLRNGTTTITNDGFGFKNTLLGFFGQLNYDYRDRYLLSVTVRRDGSSIFPEDNRWGTFPAVSVGWRISEEAFMSGLDFLDDFKIRAGWGQLGNQNIPDKNAADVFFVQDLLFSSYAIDGANNSASVGFDRTKRGNPNVTWETTETLNIGFDATLFEGRFDASFEWFDRDTEDMLIDVPQPGTAGIAQDAFFNIAEVENQGIELALNYNGVIGELTYSVGGNISTYRNEVIELDPDNPGAFFRGGDARQLVAISRTQAGQPIASFHGFVVEGIFQDQAEVDAAPEQTGARPGTFRFRDVDGNGIVNDDDRTFIGNPHPDYNFGLNFDFGYKNFSLNLFVNGQQGNKLFHFQQWFTDFNNFQGNRSTRILDAWSPENRDGTVPSLNENRPTNESLESTYYVEDGSFTRIRNLQLSYSIPTSMIEHLGLTNATVFVQGKNVLTFTDYLGIEPEINLARFNDSIDPDDVDARQRNRDIGIDRGAFPVPRTILGGVKFGF